MTKELKLPCGRVVLLDDVDYERFKESAWYYDPAKGVFRRVDGKREGLHRLVAGAARGEWVSFLDGNKKNHTRKNLAVHRQGSRAILRHAPSATPPIVSNIITAPAPPALVNRLAKVTPPQCRAPFVNITGNGRLIRNISQIAGFDLSDPDIVIVELAQQFVNVAGRDTQPYTFALEGDEARTARAVALDLTDPEQAKLIALLVETQNAVDEMAAKILHLEAEAARPNTLQCEVDRLQAENIALRKRIRAIQAAFSNAAFDETSEAA